MAARDFSFHVHTILLGEDAEIEGLARFDETLESYGEDADGRRGTCLANYELTSFEAWFTENGREVVSQAARKEIERWLKDEVEEPDFGALEEA